MKEIITLLAAAIFAVFSGLKPNLPKDEPFQHDAVYEFDEDASSTPVNYKALYAAFVGKVYDGNSDCKSDALFPANPDNYAVSQGSERVWFQADVDPTTTDYEFTPVDGEQLIAPSTAELQTKPASAASAEGTLEIKTSDGYSITYNNLKCWFCCTGKTPPTRTHSENAPGKGYTFSQKQVLGIAGPNTTITITKGAGKTQVSLREFFT